MLFVRMQPMFVSMRRAKRWFTCGWFLCVVTLHPMIAQTADRSDPGPRVRVVFERIGDCASIRDRPGDASQTDGTIVEIVSERGIGKGELLRTSDDWPTKLLLRFRLRGLESLEVAVGERKWLGSVSSHDGQVRWASMVKPMDAIPIESHDSGWCAITVKGEKPTTAKKIPLSDGYWFELEVPVSWIESNPQTISLAWIDFYR